MYGQRRTLQVCGWCAVNPALSAGGWDTLYQHTLVYLLVINVRQAPRALLVGEWRTVDAVPGLLVTGGRQRPHPVAVGGGVR